MEPCFEDVWDARTRVRHRVRVTPVLTSASIDRWVGANVHLKCENLQRSGAFKYRGATNAVRSLSEEAAARGVAAHSSGNHAGALALAAATRGVSAHIVMPRGAPVVKRAATEAFGAQVVECEPTLEARERTLAEVLDRTGAVEVHPYDDPLVIAGAGTAALELLEQRPALDAVLVPVGGGGLASGTVLAARGLRGVGIRVFGGEPEGADDAARSLASGELVESVEPLTVCDGLLTSLSARTFEILQAGLDGITTVTDEEILEAMRLLWERAKLVVEPSGAVALAAARSLVADGELAGTDRIGVVLSGGNADLDRLPWGAAAPG